MWVTHSVKTYISAYSSHVLTVKNTVLIQLLLYLDEILAYIRSLEDRLGLSDYPEADSFMGGEEEDEGAESLRAPEPAARRPDAVSNAFKVLSIQERILEKSAMDSSEDTENELGEGERALVHQICKVRFSERKKERKKERKIIYFLNTAYNYV